MKTFKGFLEEGLDHYASVREASFDAKYGDYRKDDIEFAINTFEVSPKDLKNAKAMAELIDNAYDWEMLDMPKYEPKHIAPILKKYQNHFLKLVRKK